MDRVVLFIKIPPTSIGREDAMDNFLHSLHRILPKKASLSLEIASSEQFVRFYIVTNRQYKQLIESQLYAQYPEAEVEQISDYLPVSFQNTAVTQIDFKYSSFSPLSTYKKTPESFIKLLSAVLSKAEPSEQAIFQLTLRRVGSSVFDRGLWGAYRKLFNKELPAKDLDATPDKFSQDLFAGKLRIAYTAQVRSTAEYKLNVLVNLLKHAKGANELKKRKYLIPKNLVDLFKTRTLTSVDYWNTAELATLYHFPYEGSLVTNIVQTTSKRAPAPDILPTVSNTDPLELSLIGETNYRNDNKKFGIKRVDRRRHLYVVGKTGSGKSKLLELLLISDLQNGKGCCLIDPHGDLAMEIMTYIPQNRINDVVYIDPTDRNFPIGFNPLEPVADYEIRQQLSTFFIAIFKKLFEATWNPRMEHLIRYITLALLETPDSSVLGIARILSDTTYLQRVIQQINDPVVKAFWTNEFTPSDPQLSREAITPILNKVGQFIANPVVRNIVGQRKNVLDFEKFMNDGKIVIINLSKGKLGDENTALLGSMFITKIQQAALSRARVPEQQRRDFYFYIDEFQNFATDAFSSILSEARKYHLNLTIAHQYIAQLPDDVKATTFGNVGTIISFGIGADDAAYLAKEFSPTFTGDDLINLNSREMYIKMSIDGKLSPSFSAKTLPVSPSNQDNTQKIIDNSRLKYAQNKTKVENDIAQWSASTNAVILNEDTFPEPLI